MKYVSILTICGLAAVYADDQACAAEIFRWTDADGTVHYSDEKPRDETAVTTLMIADTRPADYDPLSDPYSIRNQARRINESWTSLAEARAERAAVRSENAERSAASRAEADRRYDEYWRPYDYRRGWWLYSTPGFQRRADPAAARRQLRAIDALSLSAPRAHSINSGVHRERVQRSTSLATVAQ